MSREANATGAAFPYPGSKSQLARWIISHIPRHHTYAEPFGGSAAVLLTKPPSDNEVFNDLDGDIVHFFVTLRDRGDELTEWLEATPYSRELHERYGKAFYAGERPDDDVERAGRWFYLRNTQFAQKYDGYSGFSLNGQGNNAVQYGNRVADLRAIRERLRNVQIEQLDYQDLCERLDDADAAFYFDPPYLDADPLYTGHDEFDHEGFASFLGDLDAKWVVSYRALPDGLQDPEYFVSEQDVRGTMRCGQGDWEQTNTERLVTNFDPDGTAQVSEANQRSALDFVGGGDGT